MIEIAFGLVWAVCGAVVLGRFLWHFGPKGGWVCDNPTVNISAFVDDMLWLLFTVFVFAVFSPFILIFWVFYVEESTEAASTDVVETESEMKSASPSAVANAIRSKRDEIDRLYTDIRDIAKARIPDFHFLDFEVSTFWPCAASPVGMCVFKREYEPYEHLTVCRYCGGPVERK